MSQLKQIRVASQVAGVGMFVPPKVIGNEHFATYLDTSDEWIRDRTGIEERRWVEAGVSVSELAEPAARKAIAQAGLTPDSIDGIIFATVTPDFLFPGAACVLQKRLGIGGSFAFDLNAVCSGFVYALTTADSLIANGLCKTVLVVGADLFSGVVDKNDRSTAVLFGDGAGALVLTAASSDANQPFVYGDISSLRGIYSALLKADGSLGEILCAGSGTARPMTAEGVANGDYYLRMTGREVFKQAVRSLADISESVVSKAGLTIDDVDYVVTHQANKRIIQAVGKQLNLPENKVLMNVSKYGNTSAASLPLLLAEATEQGTIKKGDLVLLSAFGGGLTWGAMLVRW